ncbi:hypothetical protein O3I_016270 [Nocardia brasiliensis ATCC 700358]|uniref:Uncharacterized protein n=2 Tax=Nocardia brasiliensis TaxID=37326 RepID=K0EWG8_NOCB7|nr:hypothetical protein O3I_016270 [Nocardia brasiliensis ATCC 700358]
MMTQGRGADLHLEIAALMFSAISQHLHDPKAGGVAEGRQDFVEPEGVEFGMVGLTGRESMNCPPKNETG